LAQDRNARRQSAWRRKESEIRSLVHERRYELTGHAFEKIATNYWTLEDVVMSLLTGSIRKAQKDELDEAVDGKKYTIMGRDCHGDGIESVGKLVADEQGRLYLVITVF
jgi:hypothetical protein